MCNKNLPFSHFLFIQSFLRYIGKITDTISPPTPGVTATDTWRIKDTSDNHMKGKYQKLRCDASLSARHSVGHTDVVHLSKEESMKHKVVNFQPPSLSLPSWVRLPTPRPANDCY